MTLDKAIEHGKEHRRPYRRAKSVAGSCRNHGDCPWCQGNRHHSENVRKLKTEEQMKEADWFRYDIAFCSNGRECPRRKTCRRWMTDHEKRQSQGLLLSYSPFWHPDGECVHYWRRGKD